MKKITVLFMLLSQLAFSQLEGNETPNYVDLISTYQQLANSHKEIQLFNFGNSDYGLPIYVCIINGGSDSLSTIEKAKNGTTILINNAIHPGEPDGVNASLIWINEWIKKGEKTRDLPLIAIIPAYNVGGMMNRSTTSRANQDGPKEYGFRGNARNLDLNRDFIKMDSENAKTFAKIYTAINPDVFVDNHVSDGADYQYTLTLIPAMKERLAPSIRALTYDLCLPSITGSLKKRKWDWAPYVETVGETPETGIVAFDDLPRYAMGYARLFHSLSFTVETHMLKPFPQRVQATLAFMDELFKWTGANQMLIEKNRKEAMNWQMSQTHVKYNYVLSNQTDSILFKGYTAEYKTSEVTGLERLYYNHNKPYEKYIPYFNSHFAEDSVAIPAFYIVDGSDKKTINYLKLNGVQMEELSGEQEVYGFRYLSSSIGTKPYEGHFSHKKVKVRMQKDMVSLSLGSVKIPTKQDKLLFILSALEPALEDSYFTWNFYDSYIQEKEYFSPYVFEDKAAEILALNPTLKAELMKKQKEDPSFAADAWKQLYFIYERSEFFESKTFNRLPVYKVF